ncbi:MAG: 2-phospho-L-lactate transferase [Actinomycetota bacterium]|jgi:LPPG:FO 2-phospho-L-lactate transferase
MRVTCIAGGVGGARMALALQEALAPGELTVVGNVGDDTVHWGLHIAPDLDTVLYTLTGRIDPANGWGVAGDTRHVMEEITGLGEDDWFILGDRDLALHISRTRRLAAGEPLSAITADVAARWGCPSRILAATDDRLRTWIATDDGELPFQEWLVRRRAADPVAGVRFEGVPGARPGPGVLEAIADADRIVLAPSNPFVSLDPILAVDGLRDAVHVRRTDVVAVAPLIGGRAVKGPLLEMLASLGRRADVAGAAECVADVAGAYLLDPADAALTADVEALGLRAIAAPALLTDPGARAAVARAVLA